MKTAKTDHSLTVARTTNALAEGTQKDNPAGQVPDAPTSAGTTSRAKRRFAGPPRERLVAWLPYGALILLAGLLRFWDLGAKPLHFDESEHAYYSLQLLHNLQNWGWCVGLNNPPPNYTCFQYTPLLHGPFQFHAIALVYQISAWLGAPDHGVNTTTVRIMAALLGTVLVGLPYFLRDYIGKPGAWLAAFLLAVSPSMVYFSRFAREDIYMACFTLLLVVAVARYMRERKMRWIVLAAAGFALSYATSEATFLTIAIFGSFLGALIVWELCLRLRRREQNTPTVIARFLPQSAAPLVMLAYFVLIAIAAKVALGQLDELSTYIIAHQNITDGIVLNLESFTVRLIPWLGILLGLSVFWILLREIYGKLPTTGRRGLARFVDCRQPVLDTILTMPWTHWFFALMLGFAIFVVLFSMTFTNLAGGIGDGIWRGLYYWLEQQQVQRGGQPWYYYLLLIPLYEQIGVVFGIVGITRCLRKPDRFRLFLVYWFLGNFFIYSWAGEKMPWLMIFMTMPLMVLAAIGLEPCALSCYHFFGHRWRASALHDTRAGREVRQAPNRWGNPFARMARPALAGTPNTARVFTPLSRRQAGQVVLGIFGVVMAALLLLPTLHNMVEVSYVEPADGPHEMMIYVQTPNDMNSVMARINEVDQKDFGGNHQMRIAVTETDGGE